MGKSNSQSKTARRKGSPYPKADLMPRLVAKSIDFVFAYLFAWILPSVGPLIGMAFLLMVDGLPNGQSLGKRLMGIKVVHVPTRQSCALAQSAIRNLPIAVAFALTLNPPVLMLVATPILAFEMYIAATDALGIRIGDIFADTQVIDGKVPLQVVTPLDPLVRHPVGTRIPGTEVGEAAEIRKSHPV